MRVFIVTLCYNKPEIIRLSVEQMRRTLHGGLPIEHLMVDQRYPLPDKDSVSKEIAQIAKNTGARLLEPGKNLGLHHGLNWALQTVGMRDEDIVIGYDGDSWPIESGWDMALVTALIADQKTVWASLWGKNSHGELTSRGFTRRMANQVEVYETHTPAVNSICAWKGWWVKQAGWFDETRPVYGGLESKLFHYVRDRGYRWVFIPGWTEDERLKFNPGEDILYKTWKWRHAHEGYDGDFDSWLARGLP